MNISERKFLACQALYGLMISHPIYDEEDENKLIRISLRIADKLIELDRATWTSRADAVVFLNKEKSKALHKLSRQLHHFTTIKKNKNYAKKKKQL